MTALIITHGDVDGMTCAAQLIRREHGDYRVRYSNARWIAGKLRAALTYSPARVYVTDIPADEQAVEAVQELSEAGVEVFWIDHHPWDDGLIERLQRLCAHVEHKEALSTPAGVLLGAWLDDTYCRQIANICYASEKGTEWERNWFRLLSSYTAKCWDDVLERLAYDQPFTSDDLRRIGTQIEYEELAERVLAEKPHVMHTASGAQLAVYDMSANPGVYLGKKVFAHHPVDYCLIRISAHKWQIATNPRARLDMSNLVGFHERNGLQIRVGGRPSRLLSLEVGRESTPPNAHEEITSFASERL